MSVPAPFDGFFEHSKRVSSTCLITFETNRYSVPATFANRPVSLRVYAERLVIVAEAQVIAEHQRVFTRDHNRTSKTVYDWRHYLAVVQRKPGALRNGTPFLELPASFKALHKQLLKAEVADRQVRSIQYQMKTARFPAYRDLTGFDFTQSEVSGNYSAHFATS